MSPDPAPAPAASAAPAAQPIPEVVAGGDDGPAPGAAQSPKGEDEDDIPLPLLKKRRTRRALLHDAPPALSVPAVADVAAPAPPMQIPWELMARAFADRIGDNIAEEVKAGMAGVRAAVSSAQTSAVQTKKSLGAMEKHFERTMKRCRCEEVPHLEETVRDLR